MVAWVPVLKASLPYVAQVVNAAIPAFTSRPAAGESNEVLAKQIAELQSAATHNAESVRLIAAQLEETIKGLDVATARLHRTMTLLKGVTLLCGVLALAAVGMAAWSIAH